MQLARWRTPQGPDVAAAGPVDVVVIGSGAGAAPAALTLCRAGLRVVVLEKGPALGSDDFRYDEISACRRDFFVPSPADDPHVAVPTDGAPRRTSDGWTACCVGGGTVHFSGFTYRLHPEDLALRSLLGPVAGSTLADWPLRFAELAPYYERAEAELGISGDATKNPFEPAHQLPLPPLPESGFAPLIDAACGRLGLHAYPTARAILSAPYQDRRPCERSYLCGSYGCHTGAKSSVLAALWPKALRTGTCQLRPACQAVAIETDERGRATAVRYLDWKRQEHRLKASIVVVACGAVETARLLLLSRGSTTHREGLGNAHGQVGQNLLFCGLGMGEADFAADDPRVRGIDLREPFVNRSFQDLYIIDRKSKAPRKGGTVNFLLPHGNPIHRAEQLALRGPRPLWGQALKDALRKARATRTLEFEVYSETLPLAASRVTLDPEARDRLGLPAARFTLQQHPADQAANAALLDRGLDVLRELGGGAARITRRDQKNYVLQGGTCRFGADPRTSVLDRDCRVHDARNVFVTDGSFMPTMGGVPNTLTIQANALRVADRILALARAQSL